MVNENLDPGSAAPAGTGTVAQALATNVIFIVPDGFGGVAAEAYELYKGSDPVWKSGFQAHVRTASASSAVTDSAAAATAYATGVKTNNGAVAVDTEGNALVSILSLAHDAGKSTGIVTTDVVTGATPAAFAASEDDRDDTAEIAQDYIDRDELTVILGGGREDFRADPDRDGMSTLREAEAAGFDYVTTADQLDASQSERVLGLFSFGPLGLPVGNRSSEPTLAEMTDAALDRLDASSVEEAVLELGSLLNARGGVEYTTTGHTGADVSLHAFGPGADLLEGSIDNTEVGQWLAAAMGLSFPEEQVADGVLLANGMIPAMGDSWADSLM